jgi:4-amino-4-deoxy-L-arabinose transferase-like glycosyltransferase
MERGFARPTEGDRPPATIDEPDWLTPAIRSFLALGVVLRVVPYAWNLPLWGDESFLAVNIAGRGYRDLLRPLDYGQVCPPLFLWVARAIVELFGFSEYSLRLLPLVCGVASLFLFRKLAGLALRGVPLLLAVAIFAVSTHPIRHSSDFKPYSSDLFMALVLLTPALAWLRGSGGARPLWILAALTPLAFLSSYPAAFVAGGVGLGLAMPVWRSRRADARAAFAAFGIAAMATIVIVHATVARAQAAAVMPWMNLYWEKAFPPSGVGPFLRWLLLQTTGSMLSYPDGGRDGGSAGTFLCVGVGAYVLIRRRRTAELTALLAPIPLTLAAARRGRCSSSPPASAC